MNPAIKTVLMSLIPFFSILQSACSSTDKYETPDYTVLNSFDKEKIEIRQYPSILVAEVTVKGDRDQAANRAFSELFPYISGANISGEDIAMTAPVTQEPAAESSQKIAMTVPVTQEPAGKPDMWEVAFIMPSKFTMETLPKPTNPKIQLRQLPPREFGAIRFSGSTSENHMNEKRQQLRDFLLAENYELGSYQYAFYDDPFTLPMFRRNEVLYEITGKQ